MADNKKELEVSNARRIRSRSNICEEEGKIILCLEMPGVKKENLDINIENDQLEILGKRTEQKAEGKYILRERQRGDFYQIYTIDETIDRNKIEASLENGTLSVTLYIKEAEKPRKIEVKVR